MAKIKALINSEELVRAAKGSHWDAAEYPGGAEAYWDKQLETVKKCIEEDHADPNSLTPTNFGRSALGWAADRGILKMIKYLLSVQGINVNQRDGENKMLRYERSPVMIAAATVSNIRTPKDERYEATIELINNELSDCDVFYNNNDRPNAAFDTKGLHLAAVLIKAGAKDPKIQPVLETLFKRYPGFIDLPTVILGEKKSALEYARECGNTHAEKLITDIRAKGYKSSGNSTGIGREKHEALLAAIGKGDKATALDLINDPKTECDVFDSTLDRPLLRGVQNMHTLAILIKASKDNPEFHEVLEAMLKKHAGWVVELPTVILGEKKTALEYARECNNTKAAELIEATMKREIADEAFHCMEGRRNYASLSALLSKNKDFMPLTTITKEVNGTAISLAQRAIDNKDYRALGCMLKAYGNEISISDTELQGKAKDWTGVMAKIPEFLSEPEPAKPLDPILLQQINFLVDIKDYGRLLQKLQGAHGHTYLAENPATAYRTLSTSDWGTLAKQYAEKQDECALGCVFKAATRPEVQEAVLKSIGSTYSSEFIDRAKASMASVK